MSQNSTLNLRKTVYTSLFTALIIIGGYLSFPIPFSPVPVVLSDFFVMLAGLFLGATGGCASVALFVFLGILGLPVFAGGKAGLAVLMGPTGGFLIGFLIASFVIGFIAGKGKSSLLRDSIALLTGNVIIYGIGISGLKLVLKATWAKAAALAFFPFIAGAVVKIIAAVILARVLRPMLKLSFSGSIETASATKE